MKPPRRFMIFSDIHKDPVIDAIQSVDRRDREYIEPKILGFKADFMCIDEAHMPIDIDIDTEDAPHQGKVKRPYHKMNDKHIMKKKSK